MNKLKTIWNSIPLKVRNSLETALWIVGSYVALYIVGILIKIPQLVMFSPLLNLASYSLTQFIKKEEG